MRNMLFEQTLEGSEGRSRWGTPGWEKSDTNAQRQEGSVADGGQTGLWVWLGHSKAVRLCLEAS